MSLFGAQKASKGTIQEVAHMVEHYFSARGLKAADQELSGAEGCGWWLNEGSARVFIFLQDTAGGPVLRITSPIVRLPAQNLESFYRHLLDINADMSNCALATYQDTVLVVSQRHTKMLEQAELDELVWSVAYVADLLDDKLVREHGAMLYQG